MKTRVVLVPMKDTPTKSPKKGKCIMCLEKEGELYAWVKSNKKQTGGLFWTANYVCSDCLELKKSFPFFYWFMGAICWSKPIKVTFNKEALK